MQKLHQQRGMATLLLVLLIGISIMLITAGFAKSLLSKKEATVTAHAQTNAQLMGWTGVSAFREYLTNAGRNDIAQIKSLHGTNLVLRSDPNKKEIVAKNIQVSGCTVEGQPCVVSADLSSDNKTSQAATTIQVVYDLMVADRAGTPDDKSTLSFTGDTTMIGTVLAAETPNTGAVLNVEGTTRILGGLKTNNISELVINSNGGVTIDCSITRCTNAKITINALGDVHLTDHGITPQLNIGDIRTTGRVTLQTNVKAENIHAGDDVYIATGASAHNINTTGNISLTDRATARDLVADGYVSLQAFSSATSVRAKEHLLISNSTVNGDVHVYHYIDMNTNALIKGSAYAKGNEYIPVTMDLGLRMSLSRINGNAYINRNIRILDTVSHIDGNVKAKNDIYLLLDITKPWPLSRLGNYISGTASMDQNNISELDFSITNITKSGLRTEIEEQMDFETKVDVRVYKQDANYIFTRNNGMDRVYLNHLKNAATGLTYMYKNGQQYAIDAAGNETLVNEQGFSIGRYTMNNQDYIGAICQTTVTQGTLLKSRKCQSDIIGYLPRMSVGTTLNIDNDYDYIALTNDWHIRTTSAPSSLDNAAFAPGIMYFEGNVHISGHGNGGSDSSTNTFTNTFLAEGDLNVIAVSPKIYSPYNVIRDGEASLICDRDLKTIDGAIPSSTSPTTLSSKYLIPVNLCRDANTFKYDMNKDSDGNKLDVQIDNTPVKKLDLGYVALMGNQVVRVGTCSQVYGDVMSRGTVEGSAACGITNSEQKIVGGVSSQGEAPYIDNIKQHNTFGIGSKLVIPKSEFTNSGQHPGSPAGGSGVASVALTWSKYN